MSYHDDDEVKEEEDLGTDDLADEDFDADLDEDDMKFSDDEEEDDYN